MSSSTSSAEIIAAQIADLIRPGMTVAVGDGFGAPRAVSAELSRAAARAGGVRLILGWVPRADPDLDLAAFADVRTVMPGWGLRDGSRPAWSGSRPSGCRRSPRCCTGRGGPTCWWPASSRPAAGTRSAARCPGSARPSARGPRWPRSSPAARRAPTPANRSTGTRSWWWGRRRSRPACCGTPRRSPSTRRSPAASPRSSPRAYGSRSARARSATRCCAGSRCRSRSTRACCPTQSSAWRAADC